MDKEAILKERSELLVKMEKDLKEDLIAAAIRKPENDDEPEILTVLFDALGTEGEEVAGEFFFSTIESDEDTVQYFTSVMTIAGELPEEQLPAIYEALNYINFMIPCGSFAVDSNHAYLIYRMSAAMSMNVTGEALYEQMNVIMGNAVAVVDGFIDLIMAILEGRETIEQNF